MGAIVARRKKTIEASPSYTSDINSIVTPEARSKFAYRVVGGAGIDRHLRVLNSTPLDTMLMRDHITPDQHSTGVRIEALFNGCRAYASGAPFESGGGRSGNDGLTWGRAHNIDKLVKLAIHITSRVGKPAYRAVVYVFLGGAGRFKLGDFISGLDAASSFFGGDRYQRPSSLDVYSKAKVGV